MSGWLLYFIPLIGTQVCNSNIHVMVICFPQFSLTMIQGYTIYVFATDASKTLLLFYNSIFSYVDFLMSLCFILSDQLLLAHFPLGVISH